VFLKYPSFVEAGLILSETLLVPHIDMK